MTRAASIGTAVRTVPFSKADGNRQPPRGAQEVLIQVFNALGAWNDRARERRRLAALDDKMLHDIGVDHASAAAEACKPFWRA